MARIAGVDIPRDKRVVISLTYIYGIGKPTAQQILAAAGVSEDTRVRDLTEDELNRIRAEVDKLKVEGARKKAADIDYNGKTTVTDLSMINQAMVGKLTL